MNKPFSPLLLKLKRDSPDALFKQIYDQLREHIIEGRLRSGDRLPPARKLAADWNVSRITTEAAYKHLTAEGYVHRRIGSGTYVADAVPDASVLLAAERRMRDKRGALLSIRGRVLSAHRASLPAQLEAAPFQSGLPELGTLPTSLRRLTARQLNRVGRSTVGYGDAAGLLALRRAIADHLTAHRGVHCRADQIVITSGAQQAINLCARLLLDPGDEAWVEDPCYAPAVAALKSFGVKVVPLSVDAEGLNVQAGREKSPAAKLAYVTPSRQYPLGVSMSMQRRKQLLEWAGTHGAWIVEDDYDAELGYRGQPLSALKALDRTGRVIFVGTFSSVLFPAVRIGYLVLPEELVGPFVHAKWVSDRHLPSIAQAVLSDFIAEGLFSEHIRRMRRIYRHRRSLFSGVSYKYWRDLLHVDPATGGLFTVAWLKEERADTEISAKAAERGVFLKPTSPLYLEQQARNGFLVGFAAFSEKEMVDAAKIVANIIRNH